MASYSKPTQEEEQAGKDKSLLQRYATPIPATPEDVASMVNPADKQKQPPRSFLNGPGQAGQGNSKGPISLAPVVPGRPAIGLPPTTGAAPGNGAAQGAVRPLPPLAAQQKPPMPMQAGPSGIKAPTQMSPQPLMNRPPQGGPAMGQGQRPPMLHPGPNQPMNGPGVSILQRSPVNPVQMPGPPLERDGNSVILHRAQHFILRTTIRPGLQRPNPLREHTGNTAMIPRVMPAQKQHMAESETKMMPSIAPINPLKQKQFPVPLWLEAITIVIILAGSLIAHAFNMFNFPHYQLDEGTYMSAAWAIIHNGQLWPYSYGYGHPPFAWIQIAGWVELIGGFFKFGDAVNTGRVLMLFYAVASALLVYLIIRRLVSSRSAGLLAMAMFTFSPLAVTYQREVLLDNVGTFWLLLSLYLMVVGNSRLKFLVGSAICLGLSFLSKEIFVLFIPVMIYGVWLHSTQFQRKFALVAFIYSSVAVCSAFVLLAVLKGELLPTGWLPWDTHKHLSMFSTYLGQVQRGTTQGSFAGQWNGWTGLDTVLMYSSIGAVVFNLIAGWWNRKQLFIALIAISFWILLIRGGVVLSFYIIPMIPLAAINAAFALNTIFGWLGKVARFDLLRVGLLLCVFAAVLPYDFVNSNGAFTQNSTASQVEAIAWVRSHVPHNAFIVINDWMFVDLRQAGGGAGTTATYPFANVYFNIDSDPTIGGKGGLLDDNYDRIDYVIEDSEMAGDLRSTPGQFPLILTAIHHSVPVAYFVSGMGDNTEAVTIYQVVHQFQQPVVMTSPGTMPQANIAPPSDSNPIERRFLANIN